MSVLLLLVLNKSPFSAQTWGSVHEGASCPDVQSFLSSVKHFITNLNSARVNMERKFQLQHMHLPDAIRQLSSPADYTAAGRTVDHTPVPSPTSSILLTL